MITKDEIVEIGKFQKTHALKGELNALIDVEPDYLSDGNPLIVDVDGIYVPFYAETVRPKGQDSVLVKLKEVDSQEQAREFVNKTIYARREDLADYFDVEEDELASDFEGYKMIDSELGEIGTVTSIDDTTVNVLFEVQRPDGSVALIPAAEEFIDSVDPELKVIKTTLPGGLLDM